MRSSHVMQLWLKWTGCGKADYFGGWMVDAGCFWFEVVNMVKICFLRNKAGGAAARWVKV